MTILFEKSGVDMTRPDVIKYLNMEKKAIKHAWENYESSETDTNETESEFEKYFAATYGNDQSGIVGDNR